MEKIALYGPGSFYTPELIVEKSSIICRVLGFLISCSFHIFLLIATLLYFDDLVVTYKPLLPPIIPAAIHVELAQELPNKYHYADETKIAEVKKTTAVEIQKQPDIPKNVVVNDKKNNDTDGSSLTINDVASKVRYEQVLINKLEDALNSMPDYLELPHNIVMIIKIDRQGKVINITLPESLDQKSAAVLKENIMRASPFPKPTANLFHGKYVTFKIPFGID